MTAAPKRTSYDDAAEAEIARWPGVTFRREVRSKHFSLVLMFGGKSRFVTYPASPSDGVRGALAHVSDIRATLRELGAERAAVSRKAGTRRRRSRVEPPVTRPLDRPTLGVGPLSDPFAALAAVRAQLVDRLPMILPIPASSAWWEMKVEAR